MHKKTNAAAVQFFMANAGSGQKPGATKAQAKRRNAVALAEAESEAASRGWRVKWEHDEEEYQMGDAEEERPFEVLSAVLYDGEGNVLGSLGGIGMSGNAAKDRAYGRVVEAELASEAL